jgi:hypothetical protein
MKEKDQLETQPIAKNDGQFAVPDTQRLKETITGTLTSRIETKNKSEPCYYGFFKLKGKKAEIPVIFKGNKPNIPKKSEALLTGNWANSNGSRPSFTCQEYQILKDPPPLTSQNLRETIQKLLSLAWEHQKHWTNTTKFLTKKQEQLKELEKYQKHPALLQAYLFLKAFYYSNEYREQLILNEPEFINKIASEIEPLENQIKALQAKSPPELNNQQLLRMLGQRIATREIKNNHSFLYEEDHSGKGKTVLELTTGKIEPEWKEKPN